MSENDDALLDEDLGDEEYNLGNDEEEALLADDYDFEKLSEQQTISKGEEETDDVLDLGVTDALDDLETEEENVHFKIIHDSSKQNEGFAVKKSKTGFVQENELVAFQKIQEYHDPMDSKTTLKKHKDLREKLREKTNSRRESFCTNSCNQLLEDDEFEVIREKRNRFLTERVSTTTKMNHDIPDSLENVLTVEHDRSSYKDRERGDRNNRSDRADKNEKCDRNDRVDRADRADQRNNRGKYDVYQFGRYYHSRAPSLPSQQAALRGPPIDSRISFEPLRLSNNTSLAQQHQTYSYHNSQGQTIYSQHRPQFIGSNLAMVPNPFADTILLPQNPHINISRTNYGSRGPPVGPPSFTIHSPGLSGALGHRSTGPPRPLDAMTSIPPSQGSAPTTYNSSTNHSQFPQENQAIFPNQRLPCHLSDDRRGLHQSSHISSLPAMQGSGVVGAHMPANQVPIISASQVVSPQNFNCQQTSNLSVHHQNISNPIPNQSSLEGRLSFSEVSQFKIHPTFDTRDVYCSNPPVSQINNAIPPISRSLVQTSSTPILLPHLSSVANIQNVPVLSTGHKILINPHFRGNPAKCTAQSSADKFVQALKNASKTSSTEFGFSNQQSKSDDPYSYFSDVWQENKPQKSHNICNSRRSYTPESVHSKSSSYSNYNSKYKSENQLSHKDAQLEKQCRKTTREDIREKEPLPKLRNSLTHRSSLQSNKFQNENDTDQLKISYQKDEHTKTLIVSDKELSRNTTKKSKADFISPLNKTSPKKLRLNEKHGKILTKKVEDEIKKVEEEKIDSEIKEYERKMEEQKRLREKILREKENRRKLAALQKHNLHGAVKAKPESTTSSIGNEHIKGKMDCRSIYLQCVEEKPSRLVRTVLTSTHKKHLPQSNSTGIKANSETDDVLDHDHHNYNVDDNDDEYDSNDNDDLNNGSNNDSIYDRKGKNKESFSRIILNKRNSKQNLQKNNTKNIHTAKVSQQLGQIKQLLTPSKRIIVSKASISQKQQNETSNDIQQGKRIVVHKSDVPKFKKNMKSNVIKIDNLPVSTTESQLRKMCHGIGSIESIQMAKGNATIIFKTQSAATVFHNRYQRRLLDMSTMKVQLLPQTSAKSCQ